MSGKGIRVNKKQGNAPCLGCDRRATGCHGKCETYKTWRAPFDRAHEARIKQQDADAYEIARLRRLIKESRHKNGKG